MEKSESVKELFVALTKFRKSLKQPLKDAQNPFFKKNYVPLENVVETIDKAIVDTGLSYLQEIAENRVNTIITHESGQYLIIGGSEVKPVKPDPQALGSAITYAKRYSLCCAFGITSDEDDDGNAASGGKPQQQAQNNQQQHGNYQNQQRNNYQQQGQYPPRNY